MNLSGGVETNRANAIQLEIICYSAKGIADQAPASRLWVGNLPDTAYADIREWLVWLAETHQVNPTVWPGKQALSSAQANAPAFRMTAAQWNVFNGVCGHQHVPENTHWDPGALDWSKLVTTSQGGGQMGWQWNDGAGAPIKEVTPDADQAVAHQGSFFSGTNVMTYLLGAPDKDFRRGILLGVARMTEEIMKIRDDLAKNGIHPK
jgi:hypothetical protein